MPAYRMLTDTELANFRAYITAHPNGPGPEGAFDTAHPSQRKSRGRGIPLREFGRGGAYDTAGEPAATQAAAIKMLKLLADKLSAEDWVELQMVLCDDDDLAGDGLTEQLAESGEDDPDRQPAMDARRRRVAEDAKASFAIAFPEAHAVRQDPYPRDLRPAPAISGDAVNTFHALFPEANSHDVKVI